jgi:triosephosphate isomerase (TIM)
MPLRKLIAGNWKMNGNLAALEQLVLIGDCAEGHPEIDVALFPPATLIAPALALEKRIIYGAQDCHWVAYGAHTGCLSVDMIKEAGAKMVILGHSERRIDNHERNADVERKALIATLADMIVIICVGETERERDKGEAFSVVLSQLRGSVPKQATALNTIIAYEPIWAIGTDRLPTNFEVATMHAKIRDQLIEQLGDEEGTGMRILYGGSVRPSNVGDFLKMPNVDGALVGGASLKAEDFVEIIEKVAAQQLAA